MNNQYPQSKQTAIKGGGIASIQRTIEMRLNEQEQNIQESFKDLNNLIDKAKDMVKISSSIIDKIKSKQQQLQQQQPTNVDDEDDLNKLKSCLFNMGIINNPVTKDNSGSKYYDDLAMEIYRNFKQPIADNGGLMTLSDVYCRLNRARGMAGLISPDDLLNSCKQFNIKFKLNMKYFVYKDTNLHVLQINEVLYDDAKLNRIYDCIKSNKCSSAENLSKLLNLNVLVIKQQLLYSESIGQLCRDDTNYGLYFYINLFV
jgi:ESCRT-II complex subunit VPS36